MRGFIQIPLLIAFFVGAIVFGGGGYYFATKANHTSQEQSQVVTPIPNAEASTTTGVSNATSSTKASSSIKPVTTNNYSDNIAGVTTVYQSAIKEIEATIVVYDDLKQKYRENISKLNRYVETVEYAYDEIVGGSVAAEVNAATEKWQSGWVNRFNTRIKEVDEQITHSYDDISTFQLVIQNLSKEKISDTSLNKVLQDKIDFDLKLANVQYEFSNDYYSDTKLYLEEQEQTAAVIATALQKAIGPKPSYYDFTPSAYTYTPTLIQPIQFPKTTYCTSSWTGINGRYDISCN